MLTLTLVRHGATALNAERRYQGHVDPPLSREGVAQARALAAVPRAVRDAHAAPGMDADRPSGVDGDRAPGANSDHPRGAEASHARGMDTGRAVSPPIVYTSDLQRARRTAALALPGIPAVPDPRLRELDFGAFDGRSYDENLAAFGDAFRAWIADPARVRPPRGESLAELEARVIDWLDELPREGHVIAFTHGGPIRAILAHLRRVPFSAVPQVPVAPGGAIRLVVPAYSAGRPPEGVRIFRFVLSGHVADLPAPLDPDPRPDPVGAAGADATGGANHATPRPHGSRR